MQAIVNVHFPKLKKILLKEALDTFYRVRDVPGLKKKPSTSELLDWIKLLLAEDVPADALLQSIAPNPSATNLENLSFSLFFNSAPHVTESPIEYNIINLIIFVK